MCYSIPGKVISLQDRFAIVDYFGEKRKVLNEFSDIDLGDYVYAQGGFIVQKIPKQDALLILKEWKKTFFDLKKIDSKISNIRKLSKKTEFTKIIEKVKKEIPLKREEILKLLKTNKKEELELLFKTANNIRRKNLKNSCCVHGIIEFSNYCRNNCLYCGIRKGNKNLKRYRMSIDEILKIADYAVNKLGFKALVLQSGEDLYYTDEMLCEIIRKIKLRCPALLFMSIGNRSFECYKKMYSAGARGILLRFETSNLHIYQKLHSGPKENFRRRIQILKYANKVGYLIATGFLIGLPGQKEEDLMNDIFMTKNLNAEMWSIGPFIPNPETPLANFSTIELNTVLKVIAVSRFINPNAKILVTTALETLYKEKGAKLALLSGANSLMINLTPKKYKRLYSIYPNRAGDKDSIERNIERTLNLLYSLGRAPTDIGI
ncbi:MAG: [FeFe] hydrogenase H-cluster radical SAM maturase HydE [Candidatus Altiarchaeota archaeon]